MIKNIQYKKLVTIRREVKEVEKTFNNN